MPNYGFITFQVDSSGPVRKLATWGAMITNLEPAWQPIGALLRSSWLENFAVEGGMVGKGGHWKALRPATVRDRERKGFPGAHPILFRTGELFDSVVNEMGADHIERRTATSLTIGTAYWTAGWHQRGTSRMAPRPIIGISKDTGFGIIQSLNAWIQVQAAGVWKRA